MMHNMKLLKCLLPRVPFRRVSAATCHPGLLQGIEDITKAKYYSRNMDLLKAVDMLKDSQYIYNAAIRDCEVSKVPITDYLDACFTKARKFVNSDEIFGREKLIAALTPVDKTGGMFICLVGGENTGKTILLKSMAESLANQTVHVDLRRHGAHIERSIFEDIYLNVAKLIDKNCGKADKADKTKIVSILSAEVKEFEESSRQGRIEQAMKLVSGLIGPTLIVDEANIALTARNDEDYELWGLFLALLTKVSKQDKKVIQLKRINDLIKKITFLLR